MIFNRVFIQNAQTKNGFPQQFVENRVSCEFFNNRLDFFHNSWYNKIV